ncbi:MAG TPA: S8 family peptidase [Candidatus Thermoplasmatota archaeon]|nr:S8 family peptidase [Candidatus Thermoplasmatota archaeon]
MRVAAPLALAVAFLVVAPHLVTSSEGAPAPKVRLVVGFHDGLPADLGALLVQAEAQEVRRDEALRFVAVTTRNPEAAATLAAHPQTRYVAVDGRARTLAVPDDPEFANQWGLHAVRAPLAWGTTRGEGVLVAIVDTGIDLLHPDLAPNLYLGPRGEQGYDFVNNDTDPDDDHGHGTLVAGVVGAVADNGFGVAGVAPEATLLPVKVLDEGGEGDLSLVATGVRYAADRGAHVIVLSLGSYDDTPALRDALQYAVAKGALPIAATGNHGLTPGVLYPAAYPEAVAVGALEDDGTVPWYSNGGPEVDFVAPAEEILTTARDGRFLRRSGTSFAAPHVAGVAALFKAEDPTLGPAALVQRLRANAKDVGAAGVDVRSGYGLVNASFGPVPDPLEYAHLSGALLLPVALLPNVGAFERFLAEPDRARLVLNLVYSDLTPFGNAVVTLQDEVTRETVGRFVMPSGGGTVETRVAPGVYRVTVTSFGGVALDYSLTVTGHSG